MNYGVNQRRNFPMKAVWIALALLSSTFVSAQDIPGISDDTLRDLRDPFVQDRQDQFKTGDYITFTFRQPVTFTLQPHLSISKRRSFAFFWGGQVQATMPPAGTLHCRMRTNNPHLLPANTTFSARVSRHRGNLTFELTRFEGMGVDQLPPGLDFQCVRIQFAGASANELGSNSLRDLQDAMGEMAVVTKAGGAVLGGQSSFFPASSR